MDEHTWVEFRVGHRAYVGVVIKVKNYDKTVEIYCPELKDSYIRAFPNVKEIPATSDPMDKLLMIDMALDTKDEEWFKELCGEKVVEG